MTVFLLIGALGGAAVVGYLIGILSGIAMMRRQMTDELCREQTAHKQSLTYLVRNGCQDWSPEVQYREGFRLPARPHSLPGHPGDWPHCRGRPR